RARRREPADKPALAAADVKDVAAANVQQFIEQFGRPASHARQFSSVGALACRQSQSPPPTDENRGGARSQTRNDGRQPRRSTVPKLIYSMTVSLDGFIDDRDGQIDWSAPDEELHRFHNQLTRELGVILLGRRLYETMVYWET